MTICRNLMIISLLTSIACGSNEKTALVDSDVAIDKNNSIISEQDLGSHDQDQNQADDSLPEPDTAVTSKTEVRSWVVSPEAAKTYLDNKPGMILDTRSEADFAAEKIEGSMNVNWQTFSMTQSSERGELLPLSEIGTHLAGLKDDEWVFVVGDPVEGWGEDGRIVWMLQALGHKNAALVDGGFSAAKKGNITLTDKQEPSETPTSMADEDPVEIYTPSVTTYGFSASADDVKAAITSEVQLIDVREKREFDGETPYGESRGGHVPSAKHLHYKTLLDSEGNLLSRQEIRAALKNAGIDPDKPSIAYCTGGVRSAWLTAVLVAIGIETTNYAGSMWQWSSYPEADYPLE